MAIHRGRGKGLQSPSPNKLNILVFCLTLEKHQKQEMFTYKTRIFSSMQNNKRRLDKIFH